MMNSATKKSLMLAAFAISLGIPTLKADETCQSPYMPKITGQEDVVYVWTLGAEGVGDEQDKMVTVDVNPKSKIMAKSSASVSVGGRNEAHHSDFTDDRHFLWLVAWIPTKSLFSMSTLIQLNLS